MKEQLLFDFSVDKENNTIEVKREFEGGCHSSGAHGRHRNCLTNGGGLNLGGRRPSLETNLKMGFKEGFTAGLEQLDELLRTVE